MKKSFDYFKTFKILTEDLNKAYVCLLKNEDFEKCYISFSANKTELIDNLKNDFITPIERGDIFLLSEILSNEMTSIIKIKDYSSFVNSDFSGILKSVEGLLFSQEKIFSTISKSKLTYDVFNESGSCLAVTQKLNKEISKCVKKTLLSTDVSTPLLKYVIYSLFNDLVCQLITVFTQIQRIVLNNS